MQQVNRITKGLVFTMQGRQLIEKYKMAVRQAYLHRKGFWYWPLERFPGAYFDAEGCIVFNTELDFLACPQLGIGANVWVKGPRGTGISSIPGHQKLQPPPSSF
jgi:hypothetical protein